MQITFSIDEIQSVVKQLLNTNGLKKVITFHAEMGVGKTTFIKEIVKQLGVNDNSSSPTFSLVNEYQTSKGETVYHFDLYRLNSIEEAFDFGIEDYLQTNGWLFIEWPELIENYLDTDFHKIELSISENNKRILTLK